jgi:non-lysosomal glucosylceramidase
MALKTNPDWPVLTRYDQDHLARIAMPIGGIGTGTVSLGGRGELRDWEIVNRPSKGLVPRHTFFALYAKRAGAPAVTRALEGAIAPPYDGGSGCRVPNHGLPRFRTCSFCAAYPLAQVLLRDPDVPLDVRLEAFNPFVPGDADLSGMPVAVVRFVLVNKTAASVAASVCGSVQNFIGSDGVHGAPKGNRNSFRKAERPTLCGLFMDSEGVGPLAEQFGTMALVTTAASGVSHRIAWTDPGWNDDLLDFWDDFSDDGRLEPRAPGAVEAPMASLAVSTRVPPRGTRTITFLLAWHFPNRRTWTPVAKQESSSCCCGGADGDRIGNYYATQYRDAWDAAVRTAAALRTLEAQTVAFVRAFCDSDLPAVVKDAALSNASTLRTQTCFRTEDGRFYGWEGCCDDVGCCHGSCTHVWNYEQATAFLFGDLSRSMREVEFLHAVHDDGLMSFRVNLPLERAREFRHAAADGQMGCLMKLYRDWQLSGDDAMLKKLWPSARKALEFCWIPGGWDADRDGVMEGCQHNTMDIEYHGPNPEIGVWYLGALRAAEAMARAVGEKKFAATCRALFERGSRWLDEHLFNGEYYEHEIRPLTPGMPIADGLRLSADDPYVAEPRHQLGAGCLSDQLVGQLMAHVCGLGYLLDEAHVRAALKSILQYNFQNDLRAHFTHMRTYALADEQGLLVASYPRGRRPQFPFPYASEVWTGIEYTAAAHMIYEGMTADGLRCIAAVCARHDGAKRNPFDEPECGHHYARAMASWAAVLALTGFRYSGVDGTVEFAKAAKPARAFWSNGYAWGTATQRPVRGGVRLGLSVLHGSLRLRRVVLKGFGSLELARQKTIATSGTGEFLVAKE